ncbi:hypothetical protein [Streptomyces mutabilis]|uniref:hypothetical protein n=1 Tax=Streptomyces mutabilis TaxID=67332 RepID=UPI0011477128|nr:hypothetical protein [Streptomyces mutabilis]
MDVLDALSGDLDRPGGAVSAESGHAVRPTGPDRTGRRHSRTRRSPEALGKFPAAIPADETGTPGDGQVRALVATGRSAGAPRAGTARCRVPSLPHGWGRGRDGRRVPVAVRAPEANVDAVTDAPVDGPLSGDAVFDAAPAEVSPGRGDQFQ